MCAAMSKRRITGVLLGVVVAAGAAVGGYVTGRADSPTREEAERSGAIAEQRAFSSAYARAEARGKARGLVVGRNQGEKRGRRVGRRRGFAAGKKRAEQARAEAAAAVEAERQAAIEAQAAERAENCGAPLFVEGYCPTDEQIAAENQAETLCGGGHYEEARAQGVACFPPGDPRNP
jgi:hypothetical protein